MVCECGINAKFKNISEEMAQLTNHVNVLYEKQNTLEEVIISLAERMEEIERSKK